MSDVSSQNLEEVRARQHSTEPTRHAEANRGPEEPASGAAYLDLLLRHDPINGRGNSEVRAASMHTMQQTHGNSAMQRFMQRSTAQQAVPIQRWGLNDVLPDSFEQVRSAAGGVGQN